MRPSRIAWLAVIASCLLLPATPAHAQNEPEPAADPNVARPPIKQGSRLQGRAYLDRNRMVVGASVLVQPEDDGSLLFVTSTDEKGTFRVEDLADGLYRLEIAREGLAPVVKDDISLRFPFRAVIELPMQKLEPTDTAAASAAAGGVTPSRTILVRGHVVNSEGDPVPEATLRLLRVDGRADPRLVRSALDGGFELADLPAGAWRLLARGVGYLPIRAGLTFGEDTVLRVALVRQPAEYDPSPLELMPPEEPVPPADLPEVLVVE